MNIDQNYLPNNINNMYQNMPNVLDINSGG